MMKNKAVIKRLNLVFITIIAALGGFLFGFETAVVSGVVGFVKEYFMMSTSFEGWFVSSALLGCIIGVILAGKLSDKLGRKKVLIISAFLFSASAIGCMLSEIRFILITFRIVGGVGIGIASMVSPLYISELSPPKYRGRLTTLYQLAITIGILVAYFSNSFLLEYASSDPDISNSFFRWIVLGDLWRGMLGIGSIPSLLFLIALFFIPESPRWLIANGEKIKGKRVLYKVNDEESANFQLSKIEASFKVSDSQISSKNLMKQFKSVYRIPLIIGLTLPFLSQWSGINAIIYYGPKFLDEAGFTLSNALGGQVTIGFINFIFTFVAIFTVDRWGRKPLLILGVIAAVLSLFMAGIAFNMEHVNSNFVLISILLFIASYAFSFGPLVWVIIGEIFPNSVRGQAMALSTLSLWVANFLVGQFTPIMLEYLGAAQTFWLFAILCSPALYLAVKIIPETKGMTLEDIQSYWENRPKKCS